MPVSGLSGKSKSKSKKKSRKTEGGGGGATGKGNYSRVSSAASSVNGGGVSGGEDRELDDGDSSSSSSSSEDEVDAKTRVATLLAKVAEQKEVWNSYQLYVLYYLWVRVTAIRLLFSHSLSRC
jgi:hypothetical protein